MNLTWPNSSLRSLSILIWSVAIGLQVGCSNQSTSREGHVLELRGGAIEEIDGWKRTDLVIGGSRVWMAPEVGVDDEMIESAEKTLDYAGRPQLLIRLDATGAAKLERLSVEQLSRPIVVLVDGRPIAAPMVMSPLGSLFLITSENLTDEELDDLARRLTHENE